MSAASVETLVPVGSRVFVGILPCGCLIGATANPRSEMIGDFLAIGCKVESRDQGAPVEVPVYCAKHADCKATAFEVAENAMSLLRELGFHAQNPDHPIWEKWEEVKARVEGATA
jgi:hypothetical protein